MLGVLADCISSDYVDQFDTNPLAPDGKIDLQSAERKFLTQLIGVFYKRPRLRHATVGRQLGAKCKCPRMITM